MSTSLLLLLLLLLLREVIPAAVPKTADSAEEKTEEVMQLGYDRITLIKFGPQCLFLFSK